MYVRAIHQLTPLTRPPISGPLRFPPERWAVEKVTGEIFTGFGRTNTTTLTLTSHQPPAHPVLELDTAGGGVLWKYTHTPPPVRP